MKTKELLEDLKFMLKHAEKELTIVVLPHHKGYWKGYKEAVEQMQRKIRGR